MDNKINNIFGVPIFKKGNVNCPFYYDNLGKKGDSSKFSVCTCPIREIHQKENNVGMIIKCADNYNECSIYQKQNDSDIRLVENYLNKYSDGLWVQISDNHWTILRDEKISIHEDAYLNSLFNYYGYCRVKDETVEGIVYCGEKLNISERMAV